jgi:hypothetical protein
MLLCGGGFGHRSRDDFVRVSAAIGFNRWCGHDGGAALDRSPLHLAHLTRRCRLGLQRLEEPQGAPKLGERRAAIAQERVERARAVAIADQGKPEVAVVEQALHFARKKLGLDALGSLEPPGGAGDARGKQALQGPLWGQFLDQRGLERREFPRALVANDHELLGAKAVLEGVLRRARLAFGGFGPARFGAVATARRGARGG